MTLGAHIPGTAEHQLHKDQKKVQEAEKDLHKHAAKQEAKDNKVLAKEEHKLQQQQDKVAKAATKAGHV